MSARRPVSDATLRGWVKECRQLFPTDKPVRVRRVRAARRDWAGFCRDAGDYIEIKIDERLDRRATADVLLHEWAHALRDEHEDGGGDGDADHDDAFWILYGSMYRTFYQTK